MRISHSRRYHCSPPCGKIGTSHAAHTPLLIDFIKTNPIDDPTWCALPCMAPVYFLGKRQYSIAWVFVRFPPCNSIGSFGQTPCSDVHSRKVVPSTTSQIGESFKFYMVTTKVMTILVETVTGRGRYPKRSIDVQLMVKIISEAVNRCNNWGCSGSLWMEDLNVTINRWWFSPKRNALSSAIFTWLLHQLLRKKGLEKGQSAAAKGPQFEQPHSRSMEWAPPWLIVGLTGSCCFL